MSSAYVKAKLKSSRDAIKNEHWQQAEDDAKTVLEYEPDNYNAVVFRALALLKLNKYDDSEAAYRKATELQPDTVLAWQGLEKFYNERRQPEKGADCARRLADIFLKADDAVKCAEALQRYVAVITEEGGTAQRSDAMQLWLPSSPYYALLSTLPAPDQSAPKATTTFEAQMAVHVNSLQILQDVIGLEEALEQNSIDKEVDRRRMRLDQAGKSRAKLQAEIGVEYWSKSKLPDLYDQLMSHPRAGDEHRRVAESKLLAHKHRLLLALPNPSKKTIASGSLHAQASAQDQAAVNKAKKADEEARKRKVDLRDEVWKMARGMVTIDVPDDLAWSIELEWTDVRSLADLDRQKLRAFVSLFPRSPKSSSFRALLLLLKDEQFAAEEEARKKERDVDDGSEGDDPLTLAIDGLEGSPNSLLAYRIAATLYLLDRDFASTAELALAALNLLASQYERDIALDLPLSRIGLASLLATAYTHLFPPQNHPRALRYADAVLAHDADDLDALLARAYIAQMTGRWADAKQGFLKVRNLAEALPSSPASAALRTLSISSAPDLEARAEIAWCDVHLGELQSAADQLRALVGDLDGERSSQVSAEERAKSWWRLGRCLWDIGGESRADTSQAFTCFITCLKRSPSFASAYTSLGLYYDTVLDPPNTDRAAKCFQKAFELDARETVAARRLAEGFADDREWDLVDVVARRTVEEGEGASEALQGSASASRRHTTQNAWAWKAIGRVELDRAQFEKAIVALQIAIRAESEDANAWHQLGEAYAASGRHVAALKSFDKALELLAAAAERQKEPAEAGAGWQTQYSAAHVHRDLGDFSQAISIFEGILLHRPTELAVRVALAETLLFRGRQEYATHHVLRAEHSLHEALEASLRALQDEPHLRSAWKIVADATYELSRFGSLSTDAGLQDCLAALLEMAGADDIDAKLPLVSSVTLQRAQVGLDSLSAEGEGDVGAGLRPESVLLACIYFYKARVLYNAREDELAAGAWGDLAGALYLLTCVRDNSSLGAAEGQEQGQRAIVRQAIGCLRQAIKLQPRNELYWLALGNLTFDHSAKVAQHCFIKAIELRPKSPIPWSNLGFLYLKHSDVQLANEAFIRAQTLEPDWAQAWVGQAFVAKAHQDEASSRALFEHAVSLSEGSVLEADYGFARAVFAQFAGAGGEWTPPLAQLYTPAFALSAYVSHAPLDADALHLGALFAERLGQLPLAIERIQRGAQLLEEEYERTEDGKVAKKYAVAEANLGRIRLGSGDAAGAVQAFETALALLEGAEDDEDEEQDEAEAGPVSITSDHEPILPSWKRARVRLQAHIGIGMAHYHLGAHEEACAGFEQALTELEAPEWQSLAGGGAAAIGAARAHVSILYARVLWTLGGQEREEAAKAQLLDSIGVAPQNLGVIVSLAAAGAVTGDADLMDAALSEIRALNPAQVRALDGEGHVDFLLSMEHFISGRTEAGLDALRRATRVREMTTTRAQVALAEALVRLAFRDGKSDDQQPRAAAAAAAREATERALTLVLERAPYEGGEMLGEVARLLALLCSIGSAQGDAASTNIQQAGVKKDAHQEDTNEGEKRERAIEWAQRAVLAAPWEATHWSALAAVSSPSPSPP
ncbi:Superkiller protein 3 [Tilletia horrida]|uniref:Superkiller protein 3 n=1 Tax=Tilletia horrida TaxID=155126 RepID=A0AAN6GCR1_9BASI|nr:Superkiller protein 3 [Tilletia horrida]